MPCVGEKADLGREIRLAYSQEDKETLQEIANIKIPVLLQRLQDFIKVFEHSGILKTKVLDLKYRRYGLVDFCRDSKMYRKF